MRSINSDVAERVNKLINNQRLEILRASMVMRNDLNGSNSRVGFKVIDQGQLDCHSKHDPQRHPGLRRPTQARYGSGVRRAFGLGAREGLPVAVQERRL